MQKSLFPLEILSLDPPLQGCDLYGNAQASDGLTYYLKHPTQTPGVPITEWMCNHLAHIVGLPTTGVNQLRLRDDTIVFGSRREANATSVPDDPQQRLKLIPQLIPLVKNPQIYSSCFAFDLLMSNADRHLGNHLYQQFDNTIIIRIIDYSRAFPAVPLQSITELIMNSNTSTTFNYIRGIVDMDLSAIDAIIEKLGKISHRDIEHLIDDAHPSWIDETTKSAIFNFWSYNKDTRLQQITTYCHDIL